MFFDRAMYVSFPPASKLSNICSQACNGQCTAFPPIPPPTQLTNKDSLSNRPNNNNRASKNRPLLRTSAKAKRHSRFLRRALLDPHALGAHRIHGRAVWDIYTVWGFPGNDCWVCEEYSGNWAVDWGVG
jgi:hypothetical protein